MKKLNIPGLRNRNMRLWLEIGLAVLLAVGLGFLGNRLTDESGQAKSVAAQDRDTAREQGTDGLYPIMGTGTVTAEQLAAYFETAGLPYPEEALGKGGAAAIEILSSIYIEEAAAEGVLPEVAFAQMLVETGWLQFGGDVSAEQYNFAGIGATGGVPGNSYPDVRTGVRAQIQHLKAYATTEPLAQTCVDDRYEYVIKGSAPYVEWLGKHENPEGQGWATAEGYGTTIVEVIQEMPAAD